MILNAFLVVVEFPLKLGDDLSTLLIFLLEDSLYPLQLLFVRVGREFQVLVNVV